MAIFGWFIGLGLTICATLLFLIAVWDGLPRYNIGGAENKIWYKVLVLLIGAALLWWWRVYIELSPFTVIVT